MSDASPPSRHAADVAERWDPSELFADEQAFQRAREEFERQLPALRTWQGRLGASAQHLADALDLATRTRKRLAELHCWAALHADGDTRVSRYQGWRRDVELLATRWRQAISYLGPELLELEPSRIEESLLRESRLIPHAFYLRDLMRRRSHVLAADAERVMAEGSALAGSSAAVYRVLHDSEMPRRRARLADGQEETLTPVVFQRLRRSRNREDRLALFPAYFAAYDAFRETLAQALFGTVKSHVFRARARRYESCLEAALDEDRVPADLYRGLIRRVRKQLPLFHRYLRLRGTALGLERPCYADLWAPMGPPSRARYRPARARRVVTEGLAPLGPRYVAALDRAWKGRWIDWHPRPGKRSGAYSNGSAYDLHPFVLLNHNDDLPSVETLAHEMGHAMHAHFSNARQPYATAACSIFVAEVASTVNEALLREHLLEAGGSVAERIYLLGEQLDALRGTVFRQTMFAEFELEIHERAERGEGLAAERLCDLYLKLVREYHGHADGVCEIDECYAVEWAAVPHFHYDFYVYQYATGAIAAAHLARELRAAKDSSAACRYLEFLSAGGSDYPLELLARTGVDLLDDRSFATAFELMERQLNQLERLVARS